MSHDETTCTPPVLKAEIAHVQFETIHPCLDGNGRLGRLLITLSLCCDRVLHEPGQAAHAAARALVRLFDEDRSRVESLGRTGNTGLRLHNHLKRHAYTSIRAAADALHLTFPTVRQCMEDVGRLGIVTEMTGKARDRIWLDRRYVAMLAAGVEPL